jgi:phenylalanyl-tRNA synthetase beta chain
VGKCLRDAGGALLEALVLFDRYQGPPLGDSERSLAYSLRFRASDRTLTDAEVAGLHEKMVQAASAQLGARLRA